MEFSDKEKQEVSVSLDVRIHNFKGRRLHVQRLQRSVAQHKVLVLLSHDGDVAAVEAWW